MIAKILTLAGISLAAGFIVMLIVTEVMRRWIFFSLFLGIPAGLVTAIIAFGALFLTVGRDPRKR